MSMREKFNEIGDPTRLRLGKGVPSFTVLLPALDAAGPPIELDKIVSPAVVRTDWEWA